MQPVPFLRTRIQKSLSVPLCLSGTGTLNADNASGETQTYSVKSGQGFLIFPGQITTYIADQELPWEYAWIEFDGLRVKEALDGTDLSKNQPVFRSRSKETREKMANEMMYIVQHSFDWSSVPFFRLSDPVNQVRQSGQQQ